MSEATEFGDELVVDTDLNSEEPEVESADEPGHRHLGRRTGHVDHLDGVLLLPERPQSFRRR